LLKANFKELSWVIKFIIVDDDINMLENVKKDISKAIFKYDIQYEVVNYDKYCKALQHEIEDNSMIKIFIMDIELKNSISGIDIAEKIRETDWESIIIFITSHDKMFETVYRNIYNIFDFIEKFENMDKRLEKDIINIAKHNFDYKTFKYSNRNVEFQVPLKAINYIYRDSKERKLILKTDTNEYYFNMSVTDAMARLDQRFKQVHRSCVVNMDKIATINWSKGYFELNNSNKSFVYLASKKYK
jgi:two-component system, LytTR family, response regulator AgrA